MNTNTSNGTVSTSSKRSSYSKYTIVLLGLSISNTLLQIFNFTALSKFLTVEAFGGYRFFLSFTSYSGLFHAGYLDGLLIKWLIDKKQPNISEVFIFGLLNIVLSGFIFLVPSLNVSVWYLVFYILSLNLSGLAAVFFIKNNVFSISLLFVFFTQAMLAVYFFLNGYGLRVNAIIGYSLFCNLLVAAGILFFAFRMNYINTNWDKKAISISNIQKDILVGLPVLLAGIFFLSLFNIDKIILPHYYASKVDFGNYSFGSSIITIVIGIFLSISNLLFNKISRYEKLEDLAKFYQTGVVRLFLLSVLQLLSLPVLFFVIKHLLLKFSGSFQSIIGFSFFVFPTLVLQLFLINLFKAQKKGHVFLAVSFAFIATIVLFYFLAHTLSVPMHIIPFVTAQVLLLCVFANECFLVRLVPQFKIGLWVRLSMICAYSVILIALSQIPLHYYA